MSHLFPLIIGILSGIGSSAPLGPTNFWIVYRVLELGRSKIQSFVWGVIFADVLYAHIAFWGYYHYLQERNISTGIGLLGALLLIVLGIKGLRQQKDESNDSFRKIKDKANISNWMKDATTGFVISASNPTFIFFWLFVASFVSKSGFQLNIMTALLVYLGIILGDLLWYEGFAWIVLKGKDKLSDKWMKRISQVISWSIILFGLYACYQFLFNDPMLKG